MQNILLTLGMYLLILAVKIFEVTLATTRIVLITKGEKARGALLAFFEALIWVVLVSTVLNDVSSDPVKILVYALGFAIGNYVGTMAEERLGVGTIKIEVIVKEEDGENLANALRNKGLGVTVIEGEGMNNKRHVLIMHVKRKMASEIIEFVKEIEEDVVITVHEIKPIYGGFGVMKK